MDAKLNPRAVEQEIQVYNNDFLSGLLTLAKKLFML